MVGTFLWDCGWRLHDQRDSSSTETCGLSSLKGRTYYRFPAGVTRRHPRLAAKMAGQVALVAKTGRQGDLGQRQLRLSQHLLDVIQPAAQKIAVRWHPHGLVEGARKMVPRKPGHGGERIEADSPVKIRFDVIADATRERWG